MLLRFQTAFIRYIASGVFLSIKVNSDATIGLEVSLFKIL